MMGCKILVYLDDLNSFIFMCLIHDLLVVSLSPAMLDPVLFKIAGILYHLILSAGVVGLTPI